MKHFTILLISVFLFKSAALAETIQDSLFKQMQDHQSGTITDSKFTNAVSELKQKPEWTADQTAFLNDYVSNLPLEKQEFFTTVLKHDAEVTTPQKDYQKMDMNTDFDDFNEDKKPETKSIFKDKPWIKWALGVAGVALLFTPYKVVVHSF